MLGGGVKSGFCIIFGVLRYFQVLLCHGAVFVEVLGSIELFSRKEFISDGLAIGVESSGNVIAAYSQQHLVFLHRIAEPRANFHHASRG